MSINWDIALKVFMPLVSLFLGAWIKNALEAREKLIAYYGHVSAFKLKRIEGDDQNKWVNLQCVSGNISLVAGDLPCSTRF